MARTKRQMQGTIDRLRAEKQALDADNLILEGQVIELEEELEIVEEALQIVADELVQCELDLEECKKKDLPPPIPPPEPSPRAFFDPTALWNIKIPDNVIRKDLTDLVAHGNGKVDPIYVPFSSGDWSHPVFYADKNDPLMEIQVDNPTWGGFNGNGLKIYVPENAIPASGGDHHLTIVQPLIGGDLPGMSVGFYDVRNWRQESVIYATSCGYSHIMTGTGTDKGNTTAAGFNNAAGILMADELAAGEINHALFGVLNCSCATAIPPAQKNTTAVKCGSSRYPSVNCANVKNWPGMGSRLFLPSNYDLSGFPPSQRMILQAIKTYGVLIGDTGAYSRSIIFGTQTEGVASGGQKLHDFCEQAKVEGWGSSGPNYSLDFGKGVDWSQLRMVV